MARQVREHLDVFPFTTPPRVLTRDEEHLLRRAEPGPMGPLWSDVSPVDVVHFDQEYTPLRFAPPRFLYEGTHGRIEWQTMDNRQPIYHRNLDVDEMSYQIAGERTLMTELGTAELRTGDFVRIPAGVCHDNWGRQESHLLWYLPEPFVEQLAPVRRTEALLPPFPGWEPAVVNEVITDCLGSGPHDTAAQRADERLILEQVHAEDERLGVVRPVDTPGTTFLWRGPVSSVAVVDLDTDPGLTYTRHRNADEIQYQVSGTRVLVTQHGCVEIGPGDLVRVPIGVAATSITAGRSRHIATLSLHRLPRVHAADRIARWWSAAEVERARADLVPA